MVFLRRHLLMPLGLAVSILWFCEKKRTGLLAHDRLSWRDLNKSVDELGD